MMNNIEPSSRTFLQDSFIYHARFDGEVFMYQYVLVYAAGRRYYQGGEGVLRELAVEGAS